MTYFSLPLSFMHPSSIVMHPPKSMELSGLSLYGDIETYLPWYVPQDEETTVSTYVVSQALGQQSMLKKVSLYSGNVAAELHMHSAFDTPGQIRLSLSDDAGQVISEEESWLAQGSGSHKIEMSWLKPGPYKLMVAWNDGEEQSAVIYQIEKLL